MEPVRKDVTVEVGEVLAEVARLQAEAKGLPADQAKAVIERLALGQYYLSLVPALRAAAARQGYAIAIHGSMKTDLDLVAVPWVEGAADADALVRAVEAATGGTAAPLVTEDTPRRWRPDVGQSVPDPAPLPLHRPHGRRQWTILLGLGRFIDLAVTPRPSDLWAEWAAADAAESGAAEEETAGGDWRPNAPGAKVSGPKGWKDDLSDMPISDGRGGPPGAGPA